LEETPEEKKSYEEAMLKGYVDGYHRGSNMFYCPRKDCVY
jgi:hypothetical protein